MVTPLEWELRGDPECTARCPGGTLPFYHERPLPHARVDTDGLCPLGWPLNLCSGQWPHCEATLPTLPPSG